MVLFVATVWWLDRYDREPIWLVALTFLWGAIGSIALTILSLPFQELALLPISSLGPQAANIAGSVLLAPLTEEPAKAAFLLVILWSRHFDNVTDGFVYGAAAGLGFGMTENMLYFSSISMSGQLGPWLMTLLIRTFYSAVMHATATSIVGAFLALFRFRGAFLLTAAGLCGLGLAMGIHAMWNGLLTLGGDQGLGMALDLLLFPLELGFIFVIFQICLAHESSVIRQELSSEVNDGLIPKEHPAIAASWRKRHGQDWLAKHVDKAAYLQTLTSLALRKRVLKHVTGHSREFYEDEVLRLRRRVAALLKSPAQLAVGDSGEVNS